MTRELRPAVIAVIAFTVVLGVIYPLAVTGIAQPLFGVKADGDPRLVGVAPKGKGFFQPRPSPTDYDPLASAFSNAGPNSADTKDAVAANAQAYAKREGIPAGRVPADAAQTSASGIDPDISPENAHIQARRVARERGLPEAEVLAIVDRKTDGRLLGVIGERTVNINDINAALEAADR